MEVCTRCLCFERRVDHRRELGCQLRRRCRPRRQTAQQKRLQSAIGQSGRETRHPPGPRRMTTRFVVPASAGRAQSPRALVYGVRPAEAGTTNLLPTPKSN